MPRKVELDTILSDQGHIFGQLMREQCGTEEVFENRASDCSEDSLESSSVKQEDSAQTRIE